LEVFALFLIVAAMGIALYKRHVFDARAASRGALDAAALQLKDSIEATAETMIERMQEQAEQMTFIINEADVRIHAIDERIHKLEERLKQADAYLREEKEWRKETEEFIRAAKEQKQELKQSADVQSALNKRIFSLLEKGFDVEHISRATGVGKGAVALIEQMYKSTKKT